jgi:hypothetical protein
VFLPYCPKIKGIPNSVDYGVLTFRNGRYQIGHNRGFIHCGSGGHLSRASA